MVILKSKEKELSVRARVFFVQGSSGICEKGFLPHCRGRERGLKGKSSLLLCIEIHGKHFSTVESELRAMPWGS